MATLKALFGGIAVLSLVAGGTLMMSASGDNVAYAQTGSAKATVDSAKDRGEVGEQIDGYFSIVDGASPSAAVRNAMTEINIARKAIYTEVANKSGQPASVVAQLTGEKQIKKATSGQYVKDATGVWKRK